MPSSVKRAEELGDDLTVMFVEVGQKNMKQVEAFAYGKGWMGTPAMWTKGKPFLTGARTIPYFVLLSAEGKVLLKGNPMRLKSQLDETIQSEIQKAVGRPEDLPKSLKKAWGELEKGRYAKALAEAGKIVEKGGDDVAAAQEVSQRIEAEIQRDAKDVRWSIDNGYLVEADDMLSQLAKDLKKSEAHGELLAKLQQALDDAPEDELKAAKALAKLQEKLYEDGLKSKHVKELERIAKKYMGTKSGDRALHLAAIGS